MSGGELSRNASLVDAAQGDEAEPLFVQEQVDESLDLFGAHAVDLPEHLVHRVKGPEAQLLPGEPVHPGRRGFEREHEVALEVVLRAAELICRHAVLLEGADFAEEGFQDLADVAALGSGVEIDEAAVAELLGARMNGVDEPLPLPHLLEEPGG